MSRLLNSSKEFRDALTKKNTYSTTKNYNLAHKNALSDGDENGKGEFNGSIGSKTDIETRESLLAKNKFSKTNPYNDKNA